MIGYCLITKVNASFQVGVSVSFFTVVLCSAWRLAYLCLIMQYGSLKPCFFHVYLVRKEKGSIEKGNINRYHPLQEALLR